jgi:ABC-type amino acid transport substrate-binding protein
MKCHRCDKEIESKKQGRRYCDECTGRYFRPNNKAIDGLTKEIMAFYIWRPERHGEFLNPATLAKEINQPLDEVQEAIREIKSDGTYERYCAYYDAKRGRRRA